MFGFSRKHIDKKILYEMSLVWFSKNIDILFIYFRGVSMHQSPGNTNNFGGTLRKENKQSSATPLTSTFYAASEKRKM